MLTLYRFQEHRQCCLSCEIEWHNFRHGFAKIDQISTIDEVIIKDSSTIIAILEPFYSEVLTN